MSIYLQAPQHDPNGVDGDGWNRMSVNGITSMMGDECALIPTSIETFLEAWRGTMFARYGNYGPCRNKGRCKDCQVFKAEEEWVWFGDELCIRVGDDDVPWVMNRPDKGWSEYGEPTTWERLLRIPSVSAKRFSDDYGRGVILKKREVCL